MRNHPVNARRQRIERNARTLPLGVVDPADFETSSDESFDAGRLLVDRRYSLYCFDAKLREALFVECEDPDKIERAPFLYDAQARYATHVVRVPFESFHEMARQIRPPGASLIWVHSVGRCGSTLVSKAMQTLPYLRSLSEPDDLTQLVHIREQSELTDEEIVELLDSSVRWRCLPHPDLPVHRYAIKTRSEVAGIADLLVPHFSKAKHLFLYRDAMSWAESVFHSDWLADDLTQPVDPDHLRATWGKTIGLIRDRIEAGVPMNPVEVRTLGWVSAMEAYFGMYEAGVDVAAVRFEDIKREPMATLRALFAFCELELVDEDAIRAVLGRDSQAGTYFDREERSRRSRELDPALLEPVNKIVAERPLLNQPSVVLPGTLAPLLDI